MKLGHYELNRTYCGNNAELIAGLPDACIDLTVTSPPYDDMDLDFNPLPKKGLRTYNGYEWNFKTLAHELYRVTKPGGVCVWVVNDPTIDGSESLTSFRQALYFKDACGFNVETMIYEQAGTGAKGSNYYYWQSFEYMFVLAKGQPKTHNLIADIKNSVGGKRRGFSPKAASLGSRVDRPAIIAPEFSIRPNVWRLAVGSNGETKDHPAPFPNQLARDHITSWSNPGDVVLDPFMGSGTVGKMATEAGRDFIGFEISEKYVTLCNRRTAGAKVPLFDWTSA